MQEEVDFNEIEQQKAELVSNQCVDTFFKMIDSLREEGRHTKPEFEITLRALIVLILQGASSTERGAFFEVLLQAVSPNQWSRYFLGFLNDIDTKYFAKSTYRLRVEELVGKWKKSLDSGSWGHLPLESHIQFVSLLVALQEALEPICFKATSEPVTVYVDNIIKLVVRKILYLNRNNDCPFKEFVDDMRKLETAFADDKLVNLNKNFGETEEHAKLIKALVKRINQLEQNRNQIDESLANRGAEISRTYSKLEYENSKLKEFRYPKRTNQDEPDSISARLNMLQSERIPELLDVKDQLMGDCDELADELSRLEGSLIEISYLEELKENWERKSKDILKGKNATDDNRRSSSPRFN